LPGVVVEEIVACDLGVVVIEGIVAVEGVVT